MDGAFRRRTIVTGDVHEQCVVHLAHLLERIQDLCTEVGLNEEEIIIRMTGCPNGCARPYLAEIGFVGRAPGNYALYLGASYEGTRLNRLFAPSVTLEDAVRLLAPVIERYSRERGSGERFGDWCDRVILPANATYHSVGGAA
jgi:sulfite reductase (NADPH) hemoprotein beta-component